MKKNRPFCKKRNNISFLTISFDWPDIFRAFGFPFLEDNINYKNNLDWRNNLGIDCLLLLLRPRAGKCEMKQLLLVAGGLLEKKDLAAALGDFE